MELRQYWHVLVRRRKVVLYTLLIVAILAGLLEAYSYYNGKYLGSMRIGLQMQPDIIKGATFDPYSAADNNTDTVEHDLQNYTGTTDYFKAISYELSHGYTQMVNGTPHHYTYTTHKDYKAIRNQPLKVFPADSGHSIIIQWQGATQTDSTEVVRAAAHQLINYVPIYHDTLRPGSPAIRTSYVEQPVATKQGLSKSVANWLLRVALGLVAGIILAYLFEYLDDTVQDETDVKHWLGVPALAVIPGGRQATRTRSA